MSNVNMSLDEIISKTKASKGRGRGNGGAFKSDGINGGARRNSGRASGGGNRGSSFSKAVPAGRWKHDRFGEGAAAKPLLGGGGGGSRPVRVNLSNLAQSVQTADLEELFVHYNIDSATVHYGENGLPLGTGDVVLKKSDANRMIEDFKGVSVDGQLLRMVLLESDDGRRSVFDRIQRVQKTGGIQKRTGGGGFGGRRSGGGGGGAAGHPLDRLGGEGGGAGGAGGRGRGGRGGRAMGIGKGKLSEAELDAELDAYMKKN